MISIGRLGFKEKYSAIFNTITGKFEDGEAKERVD